MYLNQVRSREEFVNKFWRDNRSDRTQLNVDTGFGLTTISQSMWPLDAHETFSQLTGTYDLPLGLSTTDYSSVSFSFPGEHGGSGILQNSYVGFPMRAQNDQFDSQTATGPVYNLGGNSILVSSSINNFKIPKKSTFTRTYNSGAYNPVSGDYNGGRYYSRAKWEAATMSGKTPFYDSYNSYYEEIRNLGKDFSLIPEFRISDHIKDILEKGKDSDLYINPLLSISGASSAIADSSKSDFYKIYSNTDFLRNFEIVQEDNKGFVDPISLKIKCKAIKKFLPYENFYPCQKSVNIAKTFHNSIKNNITVNYVNDNVNNLDGDLKTTPFVKVLFAPGILYNSIKSGIAVDFPILNEDEVNASTSIFKYRDPGGSKPTPEEEVQVMIKQFDRRLPFEAILEPDKYLTDRTYNGTLDALNVRYMSSSWDGGGDVINYKLEVNNFLAETNEFFLKDKNYTTIASIPEGDPNFGNCEVGKTYMMRVKMNRSISGSKDIYLENDQVFQPPQDSGDMRETFTMYSNPNSFGMYNVYFFKMVRV
jgi:hypothetical protein